MRVRKSIKISGFITCKSFLSHILRKARKLKLTGWIKGTQESTNIEIEGENSSILQFISSIYDNPRPITRMADFDFQDIPVNYSDKFCVIENDADFNYIESVPQDIATCDNCKEKLFNSKSRKFEYSFLSCDKCGPKYSIINIPPFTKENSSFGRFQYCDKCLEDIDKGILDTSLTNCKDCGPKLWLKVKNNTYFDQDECFNKAVNILEKGGVLLLKSTNCFYLCSNAFSDSSVLKIREIKDRKHRPLTVMAKDIEDIEKFAHVNEVEKELLTSKERPVVQLKLKKDNNLAPDIAAGFDKIGVMLPFNPIQHILFNKTNLPVLIMSSANTRGRAVETDNNKAEKTYGNLVDAILFHNLDIQNGSDDSVVTVVNNKKYVYRSARGYAPNTINFANSAACPVALAGGAYQNSAISLATPDGKIHVTPYVGNLDTSNIFDLYKKNVSLFCKVFNVTPEYAICDLNPEYLSTTYIKSLKIPYMQMQHDYAHMISCLVDNNLPINIPAIGVIFDTSGFGDDHTVWGGEFLVSNNLNYQRVNHMPVFKMIGIKDKESQIYRLGYSLLQKAGIKSSHKAYQNLHMTEEEEKLFESLMNKGIGSPLTSAASKLFDAVASMLGIAKYSYYEEYTTLYLEALADRSCKSTYSLKDYNIRNISSLIQAIAGDVENNKDVSLILAKFHNTLAKMVAQTCKEISKNTHINLVVLSGTVWMNTFLLERTIDELKSQKLKPVIHSNISTNDEGLSVGQISYLIHKILENPAPMDQKIKFQNIANNLN